MRHFCRRCKAMQEYTSCHRTGKKKPFKVNDGTMISPECDPQGMYTGTPKDPEEKPVQDADDL